MSMNWTRLSRPRIATPRRVDSKDPSGESGNDARSVYVSARIGCSFRSRGSGGYEGVMKRPDRLAARDRVEHEASSVAPVFHLDPQRIAAQSGVIPKPIHDDSAALTVREVIAGGPRLLASPTRRQ